MTAPPARWAGRTARCLWLDVGAVLIAALMVLAWLIDPRPEPSYAGPAYYILSWGFGTLSVFAVWWRRRCASALAFTLIMGSIFLAVLSGPSLVALFSVASYRPPKRTMWMTVLALVSAPVQLLVGAPLDDDDFWRGTIPLLLVSLLAVGWGLALRARREVVESLRERARQLTRERDLVADWARRVEREEIARDMHDSLAHRLSLISMSAGALHYRRDAIPPELADLAATLQENSKAALTELRTAVRGIRSGDHFGSSISGTHFDLFTLVEDARASGQVVESEIQVSSGLAPSAVRIVYRTVQELLTNARKHSSSKSVAVTVTGNPEAGIRIMSSNEMNANVHREGTRGFGLLGVAERIKVHGGVFTVGRTAAGRFEAHAWLPWVAE